MKSIVSIRQCALRLFAIIAVVGVFAGSAAAQTAPFVMKIGTAAINETQHQWMRIFAELVEKGSKGRIKVELYPASQLGSIQRMIEGTQLGSVQAFVGPTEFLSGIDSRYQVLSAPGLFKSLAHQNRTVQDPEFNAALLALGANKGLKGIGLFVSSGAMVFNTRVPVRKLADLEGKKIRVLASEMQMELVRRVKATPVPMTLGEVASGLQQGVIDGQLNAITTLTAMRLHEVAKYVYDTNHAGATGIVIISKSWYDKLPPDLQKLVSDAGQKASKDVYPWSMDFVESQRQAMVKGGGEIIPLAAADQAQLMKLMAPIGAEVTSKTPGDKALYEQLQKVAKRTE